MVKPQRVTARAPGRVNLIGEHTDYNDGFVLPMALPFATTIEATRRDDRVVSLESVGYASTQFSLDDDPRSVESWARYVAGMLTLLADEGVAIGGIDASIATDIPIGASLSSSAALEVATGFAACALAGTVPDPQHIALLGQRVENEVIGIQSGIMDQLISAVAVDGSATQIDCESLRTESVAIPAEATVLILDTMTRRELADSEYDLRREACERAAVALGVDTLRHATLEGVLSMPDGVDRHRAHHVVTENDRVLAAVRALRSGDLDQMGDLMNQSHESLSLDYEVSSAALDEMAGLVRGHDACFGARMTGGGFAGSAVALVETSQAEAVAAEVATSWQERHGVTPDIWPVVPSAGASVTSS